MTWLIEWACCGAVGLMLAVLASKLPDQPAMQHIANILVAVAVLALLLFFLPIFAAYVVHSLYRTCVHGETFDLFDQKNIAEMHEDEQQSSLRA